MRRKRELAGDLEIEIKPEGFKQRGDFEATESNLDSFANKTSSSLADSSVYNILVDNLSAANAFIEKSKQESEQMDKSLGKSLAATQIKSKLNMTSAGLPQDTEAHLKTMQDEFLEMKEMRDDPEAHFRKLKAKIKLKCTK